MLRMVRLSEKNFKDRIAKGVSLVEFDAPWCSPCRAQASIVGELEKDFQDRATIASVNIDQSRTIALKLKIQSIPTIIIFKEGLECNRFVGIQTVETLNRAMKNALVQSPE
jgi:thioredoxin 1